MRSLSRLSAVGGWLTAAPLRSCLIVVAGIVALALFSPSLFAAQEISTNALQQISSLLLEKANRSPEQLKMDSQLVYALKRSRNEPIAPGLSNFRISVVPDTNGFVALDLQASVSPDLLGFINQIGGTTISSFSNFNAVRCSIPLSAIEQLAARPDVRFLRPTFKPEHDTGSVDTEGDLTETADRARANFGVDGTGVKVGILSDSVDFLSRSQASGDAPANLTVLPGQAGAGAGEGTAMIEIIHDIAPGAQLFFATAEGGEANFAQNILNLRAAGCDIIVDDIRYPTEPSLQDGIVGSAVNTVTAGGAMYFASAGNAGNKAHGTSGTWEGDFVDGGPAGAPVNGRQGNLHSFGASTFDTITSPSSQGFVSVSWADPLGASTNDYDLFLLDASGANVVAGSTTAQTGTQDPLEILGGGNGGEQVVVVKVSGDPRFLHIDTGRGQLQINTAGFARGHSISTNAFATAAVFVGTSFPNPFVGGTQNPVEDFSSDGPRRVFFQQDGTPITPGNFSSTGGAVRQYPTAAASDGVTTTVPGFAPFFGTSAAAPHAAAIAALLKGYNPDLTPDQIRAILTSTALDIEAPGLDQTAGAGILMALDAITVTPIGVNLVVATNFLSGGNGNGRIDPNECNNLTIILQNLGVVAAANVQATLFTTNPGVILAQRSARYFTVFPGSFATNNVAFKISTSPEFPCGSTVTIGVALKYDQGTRTNYLTFTTGNIGAPVRFDSFFPVSIPDNDPAGASSPIAVSNIASALGHVSVSIFLPHTFDSDLVLELIGPDGTTCLLSANNGFAGRNYGSACSPDTSRTTFDDLAVSSIVSGNPPFVGTFLPQSPLSVFNGKSGPAVNGIWQLHAVDQFFGDVGVIQCWSLNLSPVSCLDGGGQCPGVDLAIGMTATPEPVFVGSNLVYTISITNFGPDTAKNTVLSQTLPPNSGFVSASISKGNVTQSGGVLSGIIGSLLPGNVVTATVTVTNRVSGVTSSTASVSSNDPEFDPSNNSASVSSHVLPLFSDLTVGLVGSPNPVLVGQTLTYTLSVTNLGPAAASGVMVTNVLPPSVGIINVSGSNSIAGNTIVCFFGSLANNGRATATIRVTPNVDGTIVANSTVVSSTTTDPVPGNNSAAATVVVGPAANLALGLSANPISVVRGSNFVYTLSVTNFGPSAASGVVVNDSLPAGLTVFSTNASKGSIDVSGSTVTASLGPLTNGEVVRITIGVTTTNVATNVFTLSSSATVAATQADPVPANNSVSLNVSIAPAFVSFAISRVQLASESFSPGNGSLDPGESVSVKFFLQNTGNISNVGPGLMVTLLPTNGVLSPSAPANYGIVAPADFASRTLSFTASPTNGSAVTATLLLQDPNLPTNQILTWTFQFPVVQTFANTNHIDLPTTAQDQLQPGPASIYPSTIAVSGVTGLLSKATVTLSNLTHTFPKDLNVLLVGSTGVKSVLLSHVADESSASGVSLTLDDFAATPVPASGQLTSGSFQPAAYGSAPVFTNPAPAGPYSVGLAPFSTPNPNGTWALYIFDDAQGDFGYLDGGWSISFTTVSPINQIADLLVTASASPVSSSIGDPVTNTFVVNNTGPTDVGVLWVTNTFSPNVVLLSADNNAGAAFITNGNVLKANLGTLFAGASRTLTFVVSSLTTGTITNSCTVSAISGEVDLVPANNTASAVFTVLTNFADLAVTNVATPAPVTVGSNLNFTVTVTNRGPNAALSVVLSNTLPPGISLVSSNPSQGSVTLFGSNLVASFGSLASHASATLNFIVTAPATGILTNLARVFSFSADTNSANNGITNLVQVDRPLPAISAAGSLLLSETGGVHNGAIDVGETVAVAFYLTNSGSADSTNLNVSLLPGNGVTAPSGPVTFGTLVHGGPVVSPTFSFTAASTSNGVLVATLQLIDAGGYATNIAYTFLLPVTLSSTNPTPISIPDHGPAAPYPSTISVSGLTGVVEKVSVSLRGVNHSFPDDLDILLVSPAGQRVMLMSDAGGGHSLTNINLTFDDSASSPLPDSAEITSGTWIPTDYEPGDPFPSPAPAGAASTALSSLNGSDPDGTWSLYVVDDSNGDSGSISGGWSISITTISLVSPAVNLVLNLSASPQTVLVGSALTYTLTLTNLGPSTATNVVITDPLPSSLSLISSNTTAGTLIVNGQTVTINNLTLAQGAGLSASLRTAPAAGGLVVNTATATAAQLDLDPSSNTAQVFTSVQTPVPVNLSISRSGAGQFQFSLSGDPNQAYRLEASSNLFSWATLATSTSAPSGTLKFTNSPSASYQFYRSRRLP